MNRIQKHGVMFMCMLGLTGVAPAEANAGPLSALAAQIGLTPEALIVGELEDSAALILQRLSDATSLRQALETQNAAAQQAALELASISHELGMRIDDPETLAAHAAAKQDLQLVHNQIAQTIAALREVALDGLPLPQIEGWEQICVAAHFNVPRHFLARLQTPDQWRLTEAALRSEIRAAAGGEPISPAEAELLIEIRSCPAVAAAEQRLLLHLPAVNGVFETFDE